MSGPTTVTPVEHDGIRYEAMHWGKPRDLGQNGGFVAAIDIESGEEIWLAKIYGITYGPKSPQKYDRFVTKLKLVGGGGGLEIEDESGAVHRLDLATRDVTLVSAAPVVERKPHPDKPPRGV